MKKIVSLAFVSILLFSMLFVIRFAVSANAEPKIIYVDVKNTGFEDGTKEHPYNTIKEGVNAASSRDTVFVYNGTYYEWNITLKNDLSLIGESKDNTIIDGRGFGWILKIINTSNVTISGFTIQNSSIGTAGIWLNFSTKNIIRSNIIKNHEAGIYLIQSNGNLIENNWVINNDEGIILSTDCKENKIRSNNITNNSLLFGHIGAGVDLTRAYSNEVENNNIAQNTCGILISRGDNSIFGNQIIKNGVGICEWSEGGPTYGYKIFHNNFINNTKQVDLGNSSFNAWDNGAEGNYWSDNNGTDSDKDGIGDIPYNINVNNTDRYPLMGMFSDFPVTWEGETYHVTTISNSTVSNLQFEPIHNMYNGSMSFYVSGMSGTAGFCRVAIPKSLMDCPEGLDAWMILVNRTDVSSMCNKWKNGAHTFIYISYNHPTQRVEIKSTWVVPEFSTWTSILLTFIMFTVAVAIYKRRIR
ncbi:MAG: right-handed parallel beta-helix repeat-containing protein [Candidatus Bathyarchaeaceae archaeon]